MNFKPEFPHRICLIILTILFLNSSVLLEQGVAETVIKNTKTISCVSNPYNNDNILVKEGKVLDIVPSNHIIPVAQDWGTSFFLRDTDLPSVSARLVRMPGSKVVEIKVGSRKIKTEKFTKQGIPVVPMWNAPMPTTDIRNGAGFTKLSAAEHATVWQPASKDEGAYNHYACLIYYKGAFYAMWGNHTLGEDAPGQRVLFSKSANWNQWPQPEELFASPGPVLPRSEDGIHLKPDRWVVVDDNLYAVVYVHGAGKYPIARKVEENGSLGTPFLMEPLPENGSLPSYMGGVSSIQLLPVAAKVKDWYLQNDQISWWADASQGVPRKSIDNANLIESFMYRTKDDELVLMMRNWGTSSNPVHNNRMYVSFKKGSGGWSTSYPSDIPDAPSRAQALRLADGRILLIGNQNVPYFDAALYLDRDPLTISVSKDGYTFDKVFSFRTGSPSTFRFSGVGGRNPGFAYSSSIVHDGFLYTLYSIGKEDMGISRVPLSDLD